MITLLIPSRVPASLTQRLRAWEPPVRQFEPPPVVELSHESAALVYLLPAEMMEDARWAKLRVELNRGNRYFIIAVEKPDTTLTVRAMREGAHDVVALSDPDARWRKAVEESARAQELWLQLYGAQPLTSAQVLIGESEALNQLRQTIKKLGPTDVTVLIDGESGVGKEKVAQALHETSRRKEFVSLNCAAIPRDLLEAELFGVEKGAYTGALKSRAGLLEQAAGGTLFLDEIGEMDASIQPKLLRVLESRRARRVGADEDYQVTARVLAATNRDLNADIAAKRFRLDLYYRLAEIVLHVPPLKAHLEDIPILAQTFLGLANERFGKFFQAIDPELVLRFREYNWPGNVRELKSTVDRMVLLFDGPILRASWWDKPAPHVAPPAPEAAKPDLTQRSGPLPDSRRKQELARELLAQPGATPSWVAAQLGINASTLFRWRKDGKV